MIRRFVSGDYGLARTCWFGLLMYVGASVVSFLIGLAGRDWDVDILRALDLHHVHFVLLCVISVSIWRAAGKYEGHPAWALLAKAAVVVYWVSHIATNVYVHIVL